MKDEYILIDLETGERKTLELIDVTGMSHEEFMALFDDAEEEASPSEG